MRLNKENVAKIIVPDGKTEILVFDDALPGFGLRVRAGGKRTWIAQFRIGSKQRRLSLGSTDRLDADKARQRAKAALSKVNLGIDPRNELLEAKAQASVTLGSVADDYLARYAEVRLSPRSYIETKRYLTNHWGPLRELPINKVRRAEVAERMAVIAKENGPFAANRARATLSGLFSWAIGEGLVEASPVFGSNKAIDEVSRDRVLTDEELKLIWSNVGDGDYGAIVKLLILTGQRREEVGGIPKSELALSKALWTISAERTKNGLVHEVPLSATAVALLKSKLLGNDRDLIFGAGAGAFSGWSKAKSNLDDRILAALKKSHGTRAKLKPWRLHDIRRTVATRLGDLGVLPHVVEAVLNHVSGHRAGVAGIYNRAVYAKEKREALDRWAVNLAEIVESEGARL